MSPITIVYSRPLYTHFLFFPKKEIKAEPAQLEGVVRQDVQIPVAGGGTVHGWFFKHESSPYVVLVNHGNACNISSLDWIARNVLSSGCSVLLYDYRGYGLSSKGKLSAESICADGDAAYTYLTGTQGYDPDNVILYGQSLGCAVACHISSVHQVRALILQSGFSSLRNVAYQRFPLLRHVPSRLVPDVLDNRAILSQSKLPLLLIHGDCDRVVPFENAQMLFEASGGEKKLVVCHNAGHRIFPQSDDIHRQA
ncbi:MAG: alpha/beta hydrolase, partial [Terriglobales bacterium]